MPSNLRFAASRIVVFMPNWLGDGVMATPFLRALRLLYPAPAIIHAVARPLVTPVLTGLPFVDHIHTLKKSDENCVAKEMRSCNFDLGILLPNSFRSAWMLRRTGAKRRLGYAREARALLLTDRLKPIRRTAEQRAIDQRKERAIGEISAGRESPSVGSAYQPVPTIDYYLRLAEYLGAPAGDRRMQLGITDAERAEAESILDAELGVLNSNLITLVPGANFGSSKCWMPERFAEVADRLVIERKATVLVASSPAELPIVEAILAASKQRDRLIALAKLNAGKGVSLGALKEIVRWSALMVCNDTGPRHFAAALGTPVVTLFGPTDPVWAETFYEKEKQVRIDVPCGPCQLKKCPIDHRCVKGITVDMVMNAAAQLQDPPFSGALKGDEPYDPGEKMKARDAMDQPRIPPVE